MYSAKVTIAKGEIKEKKNGSTVYRGSNAEDSSRAFDELVGVSRTVFEVTVTGESEEEVTDKAIAMLEANIKPKREKAEEVKETSETGQQGEPRTRNLAPRYSRPVADIPQA